MSVFAKRARSMALRPAVRECAAGLICRFCNTRQNLAAIHQSRLRNWISFLASKKLKLELDTSVANIRIASITPADLRVNQPATSQYPVGARIYAESAALWTFRQTRKSILN